jgi:hypothetical protein
MTTPKRALRALAAAAVLSIGGVSVTAVTAHPADAASVSARRWNGRCEHWVRMQFGGGHRSFSTAMANWRDAVRQGVAHRGDRNPPAGKLVFWNVAGGKGHVGISVGGGRFRDYSGVHPISSMPNYLGWAPHRYY